MDAFYYELRLFIQLEDHVMWRDLDCRVGPVGNMCPTTIFNLFGTSNILVPYYGIETCVYTWNCYG
jgi:hypothetical protein